MMMTMMMKLRSLHHQRSELANGNTEFGKHLTWHWTL